MFWMAEPAAPFIKLSDADNAINLCCLHLNQIYITKFEPTKNFGSGNLYNPFVLIILEFLFTISLTINFHNSFSQFFLHECVVCTKIPRTTSTACGLIETLIFFPAISLNSCSISPVCLCFAGLYGLITLPSSCQFEPEPAPDEPF